MSSMLSSSFSHAFTAILSNSRTAPSASLRTNAGPTTFNTYSLPMNYHNPSDPTTMNLFSTLILPYISSTRNLLSPAHQSRPPSKPHSLRTTVSSPTPEYSVPESTLGGDLPLPRLHPCREIFFPHSFGSSQLPFYRLLCDRLRVR